MTSTTTPGSFETSCDREPIHTPGSIQPHGMLLVVEPESLVLTHASANAEALLGRAPRDAIGRKLGDLVPPQAQDLVGDLGGRVPEQGIEILRPVRLGEREYNAIAHRAPAGLVLELELVDGGEIGSLDVLYPRIRQFVEELQSLPTIEAVSAAAAVQVRALTGFDRVLAYRFDETWNGTVIAEDRNEALPSYLDLRFPASDIPAQARELYRLNRLRIIPDSTYEPVPILTDRDTPLDLTFSVLRSVSPVHVEYMRNMGTPASMSISIVEDGRLWGLISCHNARPRRVPAHVRTACDFLGQIVAMQISARSRSLDAAQRVERHAIQSRLLAFMASEKHFIEGLTRHPEELLSLVDAAGAAVVVDGIPYRVGRAPDEAEIDEIVAWLRSNQSHDEVFRTECLSSAMPEAEGFAETASGLLAVSISQIHPSYVLWFRPEVVRTVNWGGNPNKPTDTADLRLDPRKSFELWKETVHLRSLPWSSPQVDAAANLRSAIVGILMRKAEEMAQLADELQRSNKELEAFSYSVSHDLRAPFRHIVGFAELLREEEAIQNDKRTRRYLDTIIDAAFSAGKLVDDLLGFSQMGSATLTPIRTDMNRLVDEVRRMLRPDTQNRAIRWEVAELSPAFADPSFLRSVWQNLISNAIKYTREREEARIEIGGTETPDGETVYFVRDNGVGFDMAYVDKLFGVFQRLHRIEDYEGSGIGLANVRRIVERHGGRTWAEGRPGEGAIFYFSLPAKAKARAKETRWPT